MAGASALMAEVAARAQPQELESSGDWAGAMSAWDFFTHEAQKLVTIGQQGKLRCQDMQLQAAVSSLVVDENLAPRQNDAQDIVKNANASAKLHRVAEEDAPTFQNQRVHSPPSSPKHPVLAIFEDFQREAAAAAAPTDAPAEIATPPPSEPIPPLSLDERDLAGTITRIIPCVGAFLELSPGGGDDVWVPLSLVDNCSPPVTIGNFLRVCAVEHVKGGVTYKATSIKAVEPCAPSQPEPVRSERQEDRAAFHNGLILTGKVTKLCSHCGFMESCPGSSDVYIAQGLLEQHAEQVREGDVLRVVARTNESGNTKYKCVEILQNNTRARARPALGSAADELVSIVREHWRDGRPEALPIVSCAP